MSENILKYAILISGYMRHFETTYETYISKFPNADIYIFTSKEDSLKLKRYRGQYAYKRTLDREYIKKYYKNVKEILFVEDIEETYNKLKNERFEELTKFIMENKEYIPIKDLKT